jgi:hypothetical protein
MKRNGMYASEIDANFALIEISHPTLQFIM